MSQINLPSTSDIVIIGGGPAGASAARVLAAWGHAVLLLTKNQSHVPTLAESLPPSCRKLFRAIGVLEAIDEAEFYRSTGNTFWWGSDQLRSEHFAADELGYQVVRRKFDRLLREQAEAAKTTVVEGTVKQVEFDTDETATVHVVADGSPRTTVAVEARFVLDCSGRSGIIARRGFRRQGTMPLTLAIAGVWERPEGWSLAEPSHTLAEAYHDGWAWSVPVSTSRRYVTVMVDPRETDLDKAGQIAATYQRELAKTREISRLTHDARLSEEPWACDASVYSASRCAGSTFLLVGDAASFIDPLSSFGVKKAISSAWMAAIVANTCLVRPDMGEVARSFYTAREVEIFSTYATQAAAYFRDGATTHNHPFWTGRSELNYDLDHNSPSAIDLDSVRHDPAVQAAFAELKNSAEIALTPGNGLEIERWPGIAGREVVLEERLGLETSAIGRVAVRFVRNVDLPALVRMAGHLRHVPDLFEAYNERYPPVILPDFLGALSLLLASGALINGFGKET